MNRQTLYMNTYEYVQSLPIRPQAPTIPHTTPARPNLPATTVM